MTALNYSSIAVSTTLTQSVEASDTVFQLADVTGYPTVPFKILVDQGKSAEEVCIVVALSGVTATVLRGQDHTPSSHHDVAAPVVHGFSAGEFQDANDHMNSSGNVHGVSGDLVGTLQQQTMDHKTFQSQTGSSPALVVQGQTGQGGNVTEWRADTGSVVASVKPSGRLSTPGVDGSSNSTFTAGSAALVPVQIQMAPGQTARAFKVVDSSNAEIMAVAPSGQVICQSVQVTGGTALGTTTGSSLSLSGSLTCTDITNHGSETISGNLGVSGTLTATNFSTSGTLSVNGLTVSNQITQRANVPVPYMAAGTVSVSVSNASFGTASISFPAGRFTVAPIVTATFQNAATNSGHYSPRVVNITTNGAAIQLYSGDGSLNTFTGLVGWIAVQMTDNSADG